ncbi:glycosyltransferase [Undibacterium amnicola]|uniref:Glycosyltransferase n=2 Tax=Undibacterium amnicola TaxID=1834038 RepID=A0ABR6XLS6_9BURK|nr:glycosyltransferase [Undibacterium amnicola]
MKSPSKTAVFTIVSLNYGAFAKTLMKSLLETHPDWDRFVGLADRCDDTQGFSQNLFEPVLVESLPLPDMRAFLFRYGIMELNTAIKPYMFSHLRKLGYERIVYIDPDILVLDRLVDVEKLLDDGAAAVVTPHLTAPLNDHYSPTELDIMRAGAFNLGFLAIGNQIESDAFIKWWEEKLEHGAVSDPSKGLFTDQKWVDLAPGMFGKFAILRDPGYNVAYWNLAHRSVKKINNVFRVNDHTLRFFHFSGFDPINPKPFSKHQDRYTLETIGDAKLLALIYADKVKENGLIEFRKCAYTFGKFSDGTPIPNALRYLYREDEDIRFQAGENPFDSADFFMHDDADRLPVILRAVWLEHKHLQKAFPYPLGASRLPFYHWFVENGAVEIGIPEIFVDPIRSALDEYVTSNQTTNPTINFKPSIWARGLVFLHKKATGGRIGHARISQYQQINNPFDFIRLGFTQFRASRWAARIGIGQNTSAKIDPLQAIQVESGLTSTKNKFRTYAPKQKFSGIYFEAGQSAWWMGKQARFKLAETQSTKLRLRGIHHPELCRLTSGTNELIISVGFDRMPKQEIRLTETQIDLEIDLLHLPTTWPATFSITPSVYFKPSNLGVNDDTRELSIQISELKIGEQVLFNPSLFETEDTISKEMLGINLIGYARSEHGVGQSLRQFANAVTAAKIPFVVIDFNRNNLSRTQDESVAKQLATDVTHDINVFHINADQMPEAEMQLPSHFFSRYNIGFWHWELPEMLAEHRAGFNQLNEVWVPTGFVQEAIAKHSPIPVIRMPHAIEFTISESANRAKFGLPENTFLFLMMYDFSSYQERKNPQAALDAFNLAFAGDNDRVKLVIKTQNAHHHAEDMNLLKEKLAGRNDIIWINETLTRQEVYDLQSVCDSLVSLHRSEGYGLGPAEAMFLGKPVIATNWSGNTEFMRQDNSLPVNYALVQIQKDVGVYKAGQTWAEPDITHAAELMKRLVDDPALYTKISTAASNTMRNEFSPTIIGERIHQRLKFIREQML